MDIYKIQISKALVLGPESIKIWANCEEMAVIEDGACVTRGAAEIAVWGFCCKLLYFFQSFYGFKTYRNGIHKMIA